jgi:carbonic anhydrase
MNLRLLPALLALALVPGLSAAEHSHDGHAHDHPAPAPRKEAPAKEAAAKEATPAKAAAPADAHAAHAAHAPAVGPSPLEAIARLSGGNGRFAVGKRTRSADTSDDAQERDATAKGQHPFAAVLTCAYSRLSPEIIFDQSIGDIFVVRNAGNVAEPVGEGSLEYAVAHLGVRLIVVLGHEACGAVKAVTGTTDPLPGNLLAIQKNMDGLQAFAAEKAAAGMPPAEVVSASVAHNADAQALALLTESQMLQDLAAAGKISVVPAVYHLDSGLVDFRAPISVKR